MNFIKTFIAGLLAFLAGTVALFFLGIFLLAGLFAASMEGRTNIMEGSILKVDFSEEIVDAPSADPLSGFDPMTLQTQRQLSILQIVEALDAARHDDRIEGIYLRMNGGGSLAGSALLEEIRDALVAFKQSGKFIVAYDETYTQGRYYLASVADGIYIQPEGGVDWSGLSMNQLFFKGLMDKLDLRAEVFRPTACPYKSAVEPYILTKMSDANRLQMQQIVDSMWGTIAGAVAEARDIAPAQLQQLTDRLSVSLSEDALKYGFVDGVVYEDQMDDVFAQWGVEADEDGEYRFVTLGDYVAQLRPDPKRLIAPQVAVVYASGQIVDGEGSGEEIYGNTLAQTLAEARNDDDIRAVVLRVNSPGGSALASDVIWREVERLKAEKPVIVSMGSYAASGGYYISCPADAIVADRLTLTGSIGVFGMYFDAVDALKNKLGITVDGVQSNLSSGMGSLKPLTPLERATIMRGVDKVYATFTEHVAQGRNLPLDRVLAVAGGRVWTGADALDIGLIDGYGGIAYAIALAADKAGLGEDYRVVELLDQPTGFAAFIASLNAGVRSVFVRTEMTPMVKEYQQLREALGQQGILMYSPCKVNLQ